MQKAASSPQEDSKKFMQVKELLDSYSKMQSLPDQCLESIFAGLKTKKELGEVHFMIVELEDLDAQISELQALFEAELQMMRKVIRTDLPKSAGK